MKSYKAFYLSLILVIATGILPSWVSAKAFLVAIDIGHSQNQPGAISARGVGEYFFNKRIAEGVKSKISSINGQLKSILIDSHDGDMPLSDRAKLASKLKADLLISIHHDSVQPELMSFWEVHEKKHHYCDKYKGFSLFYSEQNSDPYDSLLFALFLGSEMLKNNFRPSLHHAENMKGENRGLADTERGIYKYNELVVLKEAPMPAILLECGIIVNRDEELELSKPECQEKIIMAIADAVTRYWNFKYNKRYSK